ncbi:uncharacterized protein EV154DRAFT_518259 [Mucor mucedo]|uniref:uncharacterized protein n=1 Tax=Mucor mucedo TaxID=29922 RepID=UPI002220D90B|nr:uncharacterized protein EV154DRAFT_518259 [Mucor mucedo]KAI7888203.1 hypothetical protein EV154DRAFT_518259 [Mucor mucedo]
MLSPPLSPQQHHRSFGKDPIEAIIPIAKKNISIIRKDTPEPLSPSDTQPRSPVEAIQDAQDNLTSQKLMTAKNLSHQESIVTEENKHITIKKEDTPITPHMRYEQKSNEGKKQIAISSTVQEKKDALKQCVMQDKQIRVPPSSTTVVSPIRVTSRTNIASPTQSELFDRATSPTKGTSPSKITSSTKMASPTRAASPARAASPTRAASPIRATPPPPKRVTSSIRVPSPTIKMSSSIKTSSQPVRVPSASKPENNFLLEAKQKLFSNQQPKANSVRKSLPDAPKRSGLVSSFISSFETPLVEKSVMDSPPKPPRHVVMPLTPTSSVSTPLSPPAVENIVPVSSSSTMLPSSDSYFSAVIDRRFNATPTEDQDEPIQVYLPQLSPEISFCGSSLDVPSDDEYLPQERPCIKKRVSFSEQLSTFIPEDDASVITEEDSNPMSNFVRTLSSELADISMQYGGDPREKFLPAIQKKEVSPQKLSNKLLDMFQKKPKVILQPNRELTHPTKTRPRKPASLKKPTTLTYPAAIAQPDWRTRALLTKKSSVFI